MNQTLLPYPEVPQLSERDVAYATQDERLRPFYKYQPEIAEFEQAIRDKQQDPTPRGLLADVLLEQYASLQPGDKIIRQIEALREDTTFTVTTAHQPSLFTGPLYYVYKIISTIRLARQLAEAYPEYQFVPLFITGGEDHDFEEINHLQLFGKTVRWDNDEGGSVGQMSTQTVYPALEELREILGDSPRAEELHAIFKKALDDNERYADAARQWTHELFAPYGLVVLDPGHPKLKAAFTPYIKKEILEQASKERVEQSVSQLEAAGFSEQAYPREINFFYLGEGFRERIVHEDGQYRVLNQDIAWSESELSAEIEQSPGRFSPNVVMRPIYQEFILPNLAYIGGGGELAYWLERKAQFEHFSLNFPVLVRRNSVLFVDKGAMKRVRKLELEVRDLFGDIEALIKEYVRRHTENEISLKEEKSALQEVFQKVEQKAKEVDPTLVKAAAAEGARQLNALEQLEAKLMRAEKQRHDTAINQMRKLKDKLFPGNGLQERYDNFMMYYLKYGRSFFDLLLERLDPMSPGFVVLTDE